MKRRYANILKGQLFKIYAPLLLSLTTACASIPKDAPEVYSRASDEIHSAEDEGTKKTFPNTLDQARAELKSAVAQYKDAKKAEEKAGMITSPAQDTANAKAEDSYRMAYQARIMNKKVSDWDADINGVGDTLDKISGLALGAAIATDIAIEAKASEIATKLAVLNMLAAPLPIAYYQTAKAEIDEEAMGQVEKIANFLKEEDRLAITLAGFADVRGDDNFNRDLAQRRAQKIADELVSRGISEDRIEVVSGVILRDPSEVAPGELQLDRRVDIKFQAILAD